jgi:ABC-type transport system involved in cytochrome c biogenesis permease subunit
MVSQPASGQSERRRIKIKVIESSTLWLRAAACLYGLGLLHSLLAIARRNQGLYPVALGSFRIAVVLQFVSLVEAAIAYGRLPLDSVFETLSVGAFLIALVFLMVEWRYHFATTAVALFPLVFLMTLIASMERPVATWPNVGLRDAWLVIHIVLVLAGFAALLLTAVASIFYLIQERRLKAKRSGTLLEKLPPLATLDNLVSVSMGLGFVLLTLGVIFAITWASVESGTRWISDWKIQFSFFTWFLCLVMIFLRTSAGWRGRKAAVMALTVLGCAALTWAAHVGIRPTFQR